MSPNGHALTAEDSQRINSRETVWPTAGKETIIKRASVEKKLDDQRNSDEDLKKPIVLPDVLPVNVKLLGPRSQQYNRPTHLSLSPLDSAESRSPKTPPSSPPKSPSRNSPFATLRTISISPLDSLEGKTRVGNKHGSPKSQSSSTSCTPSSPRKSSPPVIKPSLSPNALVKLCSSREASSATNTPLRALSPASPESLKC
ncbi:unnamed protein product [Acanthoscelides obtectus]|nr:unnamed protein product [Acanthoscelides obtectus]CAK1644997.1 hypothetical protein AOBTE_LOCUS13980 [Acanthoscelides obtectus]